MRFAAAVDADHLQPVVLAEPGVAQGLARQRRLRPTTRPGQVVAQLVAGDEVRARFPRRCQPAADRQQVRHADRRQDQRGRRDVEQADPFHAEIQHQAGHEQVRAGADERERAAELAAERDGHEQLRRRDPHLARQAEHHGDDDDDDGRVVDERAEGDHQQQRHEQQPELAAPGHALGPAAEHVDGARPQQARGEDEHGGHRDDGLVGEAADALPRRDQAEQDQRHHHDDAHHIHAQPVPDEEREGTRRHTQRQQHVHREVRRVQGHHREK
jgi:hypothetical protein